ncbi:hypothetical protein PG294_11200 [Riemerella anatipestifer]|nr:hypothetical protein [Riemerella anatipestifer]MCQ4156158.1 hypothetical protein [Riemerella anatipestifer]MDR7776255.1 hypothetical protein [Riemerella anatipestifer]MDR7798093.1 hypothetical protein [Riemerella anatipestifer]MDY3347919.1 hypothetical protein [Riemerella anatipestifer]MDY3350246.1 hypothetical protein [Riemerella anatipestifer]
MKKIILLGLLAFFTANAQIQVQNQSTNTIGGENPFMDASYYNQFSNTLGKGLYFPTTNLTTWEFKLSSIDPGKFSNYFDGMVVYNSGTGLTVSDTSKGGKQVSVSPGFYYFKNPNQTFPTGSVANGEWVRLSSDGGVSTNLYTADGTLAGNRTVTLGANNLVFKGAGNIGIGTDAPTTKLDVAGGLRIADGTQGAGKVLTSDAEGKATWTSTALKAPNYAAPDAWWNANGKPNEIDSQGVVVYGPYTVPKTGWYTLVSRWFYTQNPNPNNGGNADNGAASVWIQISESARGIDEPGFFYEDRSVINDHTITLGNGIFVYLKQTRCAF